MTYAAIQVKLDTKKLDQIVASMDGNMNKALGEVASRMAQITQRNVPPRVDTGALMGGIMFKPMGGLLWWVHDSVEYGVFQELGTSRGIQGHFFMTRAAEETGQFLNSGALWKALFT